MNKNELAAQIFLCAVKEKIKARGTSKLKGADFTGIGTRACEIADLFMSELAAYAGSQVKPDPPPGPEAPRETN
jgi:hypothetical protein